MAYPPIERGGAHPWLVTVVLVAVVPVSGVPFLLGAEPDALLILASKFAVAAIAVAFLSGLGWWGRCGFTDLPAARDLLLTAPLLLITGLMFVVAWTAGTGSLGPGLIVSAVAVSGLTAFGEEALFRGVLLETYRPFGPVLAVVGAAAVFAAIHAFGVLAGAGLGDTVTQTLLYALPVGLAFGGLRLLMRSIWPLVAIHLLNNLTATVVAGGFVSRAVPDERWALVAALQLVLVILLVGYAAVLLWRLGRRRA